MVDFTVLSDVEKINLLILAMKVDGLNPNLIADGQIGPEAVKAAKLFLKHQNDCLKFGLAAGPSDETARNVLQTIVPDERPERGIIHLLSPRERMERFFAYNGITL